MYVKCFTIAVFIVLGLPGLFYLFFWSAVVSILASPFSIYDSIRLLVSAWFTPTPLERENAASMRLTFRETPIPSFRPQSGHSHAEAASHRSAATRFMTTFSALVGLEEYPVMMCRTDQRRGKRGLRSLFWAKDLTAEARNDPMPENPLVTMTDVDYYVDLHRWLSTTHEPTLLYTFQPSSSGAVRKDYSYSFVGDQVTYEVIGGGKYSHAVWNFQHDTFIVEWTFCKLPFYRVAWQVERKKVDEDHELVFLIPLAKWTGLQAIFSRWIIPDEPLKRFDLTAGSFNRLFLHTDEGIVVSTSEQGSKISVEVPLEVDEEIRLAAKQSKTGLQHTTSNQILKNRDIESGVGSKILTAFAIENQPGGDKRTSGPDVYHYQRTGPGFDAEAKHSMLPFMAPFGLPAFVPVQSESNDAQMVKGRVTDVRADVELTPDLINHVKDFVDMFLEDIGLPPGSGVPLSLDEVYKRQNRPTQRRILDGAVSDEFTDQVVQVFMKKEPYAGTKDPRPISPLEACTKRDYSQYTYAIAEQLKRTGWYAFGMTPRDIALSIAALAFSSTGVVTSDGRRFDGHVSIVLRFLCDYLGRKFFSAEYVSEFAELYSEQSDRKAVTRFGIKYKTYEARLSGSPETSNDNSIGVKFISFLHLRLQGFSARDSYYAYGMYGGDDGITFDGNADFLRKAASMCGQDFEATYHKQGESFSFLSRTYSNEVWLGNPSSMCDVDRSMRAFNLTVALPHGVTPVMKLVEKCRSYYLTDRNTPVIGDFVSAVGEVIGYNNLLATPTDASLVPMFRWGSNIPLADQYPNDVTPEVAACANVAREFDQEGFARWCRQTASDCMSGKADLKAFLRCPSGFDTRDPNKMVGEGWVVSGLEEKPKSIPARSVNTTSTTSTSVPQELEYSGPVCDACLKRHPDRPNYARHHSDQCWGDLTDAQRDEKRKELLAKREKRPNVSPSSRPNPLRAGTLPREKTREPRGPKKDQSVKREPQKFVALKDMPVSFTQEVASKAKRGPRKYYESKDLLVESGGKSPASKVNRSKEKKMKKGTKSPSGENKPLSGGGH